jgi:hypothetical protein
MKTLARLMLAVVGLFASLALAVLSARLVGQAAAPRTGDSILRDDIRPDAARAVEAWCWRNICPGVDALAGAGELLRRRGAGVFDQISSNPYLSPESTSITGVVLTTPPWSVSLVGRPATGEIEFVSITLPGKVTLGDLVAVFGPPQSIDFMLSASGFGLFVRFPHGLSTITTATRLSLDPHQEIGSVWLNSVQPEGDLGRGDTDERLSQFRWRGFTRRIR